MEDERERMESGGVRVGNREGIRVCGLKGCET